MFVREVGGQHVDIVFRQQRVRLNQVGREEIGALHHLQRGFAADNGQFGMLTAVLLGRIWLVMVADAQLPAGDERGERKRGYEHGS